MILIYSIILTYAIFVRSPSVSGDIPLRTDYYESFSDPVICMKIFHNFPIGPLYLYSSFSYNRYSKISGNRVKRKFASYTFKRVEISCESSVIFTMLGNDFDRLEIKAKLYLSLDIGYLAVFDYKFYRGFIPGAYGLLDTDNNFEMRIKVLNELQDYLEIPLILEEAAQSYLQSLTTQSDQLCVITKNNHAIVLNPHFKSNTLYGFIYGLQAVIFKDGASIGDRKYPAYSCQKDISYPDKDTIFIIDGFNFYIQFKVLYLSHDYKNSNTFSVSVEYNTTEFELSNRIFADVHDLKTIPLIYNKLFLIKIHTDNKLCEDGSWITLYFSEDKTKYFVDAKKIINNLAAVELTRKIYRLLEDPCAKTSSRK